MQRKIEELLYALRGKLSADEIDGIRETIEAGEFTDGIRTLAWAIEAKGTQIADADIRKVAELGLETVDLRDMPPGIRAVLLKIRSTD